MGSVSFWNPEGGPVFRAVICQRATLYLARFASRRAQWPMKAAGERPGVRARAVNRHRATLSWLGSQTGAPCGTGAERALWAKKRGGASGTARSAACGTTMQVPRTDEADLRTPGSARPGRKQTTCNIVLARFANRRALWDRSRARPVGEEARRSVGNCKECRMRHDYAGSPGR